VTFLQQEDAIGLNRRGKKQKRKNKTVVELKGDCSERLASLFVPEDQD
jgi:hypothetical protein